MTTSTTSRGDPLALEQQVCFALAVTHRAVLAIYRPLLEPLGLTHPQYLVMLALWDHYRTAGTGESPTKPLSVKDIARALQLDSATLSPMLKRLESLGFITRARSTVDERATDVRLTEKGEHLRQRALDIPLAVVERLGVGLHELENLRNVLSRVNTAALAAGALDT